MPDDTADRRVADVGQWLGVLVGGLVGAFTFLGIKGEEVGVILRNERWEPSFLALLVALAIGASVLSVFSARKTSPWQLCAGLPALGLSLALLTISAFPTPRTGFKLRLASTTAGVLTLLLAAGLIAEAIRTRNAPGGARGSLQLSMLLTGVLLSMAAIVGGLRLEIRSQYSTTSAQLAGTYKASDGAPRIALSVVAEKLSKGDDLDVVVYGLPRDLGSIEDACSDPQMNGLLSLPPPLGPTTLTRAQLVEQYTNTCRQKPCDHLRRCQFIAGAQLKPNAFGTIRNDAEFPVDPPRFQHLAVTASLCVRNRTGQCPVRRQTTFDMRLPEPRPATIGG